ncbi:MAG TPA: hypothetical protein PLV92_27300, partial [Pirellulaceae bacterium]|nr:hypothetical protein [Pirellulaceae bacterium]
EPASVRGLYLKVGDKSGDAPQLVFAADRVEWHPESENEQFGVLADHVLLARHGFDQSRLADIATRDGKPLTAADTECFYGMMSAVKKIDPVETRSAPQFELGPFLQKPRDQHGKLRTVYGRAKRITRISLSDPTLKERFGVDGYYEIEVMAPLGDQEVRLPRGPDDKDPPVITVAFPIVCCVLDVPERLRNVADREDLNEDMILQGFNFRLWSYQSQFLDDFSRQRDGENPDDGPLPGEAPRKGKADRTGPRRQPSPMFIAARADFLPPRETGASNFGTWIGIGLIALIGGVFFANWWFNRNSPAPRRTTAERPKFD